MVLDNADLTKADLRGTDLVGASMNGATNLSGAVYDSATKLPDGLKPEERGMIRKD